MIPKNILTCWFGRGEKTDLFKRCLESQQRNAPDYTHIEINEDTIAKDVLQTPYIKGVLERGEFVKATELGRLWGLYWHGGIYMDSDVELLRRPDELLTPNTFFIGREDNEWINGAALGSEARGVIINHLMIHFPVHTEGREGAHTYGPTYLTRSIERMQSHDDWFLRQGGVVHPPEVFFPSHWKTPEKINITGKTIAHHHWAGSWVNKY